MKRKDGMKTPKIGVCKIWIPLRGGSFKARAEWERELRKDGVNLKTERARNLNGKDGRLERKTDISPEKNRGGRFRRKTIRHKDGGQKKRSMSVRSMWPGCVGGGGFFGGGDLTCQKINFWGFSTASKLLLKIQILPGWRRLHAGGQ